MSGRIFINYRRDDDPGSAGRLHDRLISAFSKDQIFMDVDNIPLGSDFVSVLESEIAKCDVLLAIIGKNWTELRDENGQRRLENPKDFVRIEIESGLKYGKLVIPVLTNKAEMPRAEELPGSLKELARRNAFRLAHEQFDPNAQRLIKTVQVALDQIAKTKTEEEARKQKAEQAAEAQKRVQQEAAEPEQGRVSLLRAGLARPMRSHYLMTFVGLSAEPDEIGLDNPPGCPSPFTSALAVELRRPDIGLFETFQRTRLSVHKMTQGQQVPWSTAQDIRDVNPKSRLRRVFGNVRTRCAFVVGNSSYSHIANHPSAQANVQTMVETLRGNGFKVFDYYNLDWRNFWMRFSEMCQERADIMLCYYSGHACQFEGLNYLIPVDWDPLSAFDTVCLNEVDGVDARVAGLISLNDVFSSLAPSTSVVLLDAATDSGFRSLRINVRPPPV